VIKLNPLNRKKKLTFSFFRRCGHDGVIHGGLAATVLDEMLAYVVSKIEVDLKTDCQY
jgi:acyl-coenzyme A thioesterase PaaI-like protein